jgi:hypothetical protein
MDMDYSGTHECNFTIRLVRTAYIWNKSNVLFAPCSTVGVGLAQARPND